MKLMYVICVTRKVSVLCDNPTVTVLFFK